MNNVRPAIPQAELRQIVLKSVPKEFEEYPALTISDLLEKMRPKLVVPYESLNEDQKERIAYRMKEYDNIATYVSESLKNKDQQKFNSHKVQEYLTSAKLENVLKRFSLEEAIMMYETGFLYTYNNDIKKWYEEDCVQVWLSNKIKLSSWHWGGKAHWNTIAEAYNLISTFDFGKGFDVSIDTSSHYNNKGYSRFTRTFLDAELGFIISYKGEHVLTIGFNVIEGYKDHKKKIQIRQIQCKKRNGNRWMYKIGSDLTTYTVKKMVEHFQNFKVQLIRGESIVEEIKGEYQNVYDKAEERLKDAERSVNRPFFDSESSKKYAEEHLVYCKERFEEAKKSLNRFHEIDEHRMMSIYNNKLQGLRKYRSKDSKYYSVKIAA